MNTSMTSASQCRIQVVTLVAGDTGTAPNGFGFIIEGMRPSGLLYDYDGTFIAHDLIEHQNGIEQIGLMEDELEAEGATWYVRGQYGDLDIKEGSARTTSLHVIAENVTGMFLGHVRGFARRANLRVPTTDFYSAEKCVEDILLEADRLYVDEFEDEHGRQLARQQWPAFRAACHYRLSCGYQKAVHRYEDGLTANKQFWAIAKAVESQRRKVSRKNQKFRLAYGGGVARCTAM